MKKAAIFVISMILISSLGFAQKVFKEGYFITNDGQKTVCEILYSGSKKTPPAFKYRLSPKGEPKKGSVQEIREYGITKGGKQISATIDWQQANPQDPSLKRDPNHEEKKVFLKVLIEGNVSLYYYSNKNFTTYFYTIGDGQLEPFIQKQYLDIEKNIKEINAYRKQVNEVLACSCITFDMIKELPYTENAFLELYRKYYQCTDLAYTEPLSLKEKAKFSVKAKLGLEVYTISVVNYKVVSLTTDGESSSATIRFGAEAELLLPYNKRNWSVFFSPMYHAGSASIATDREIMDVKYNSLEALFGGRRYIYLAEGSKLQIDIGLIIGFPINSTVKIDEYSRVIGSAPVFGLTDTGISPAFGIGYEYNGRFFAEIRTQGRRGSRPTDFSLVMKYQSTCVNIGYRLF